MRRAALFFGLGALLGAALPVALVIRLGKLTLAELRHLHVVLLEVKRRMSVARLVDADDGHDLGTGVSFNAPGDPEGYGEAALRLILGDPGVLGWILGGRIRRKGREAHLRSVAAGAPS